MLRAIDELEIASRSHKIRIRASLGLAGYNAETRSGDLFDRADRAMYADKRSGGREARLTTLG
jgi:predicted signal transduction protein with EAL and GGDEF domain